MQVGNIWRMSGLGDYYFIYFVQCIMVEISQNYMKNDKFLVCTPFEISIDSYYRNLLRIQLLLLLYDLPNRIKWAKFQLRTDPNPSEVTMLFIYSDKKFNLSFLHTFQVSGHLQMSFLFLVYKSLPSKRFHFQRRQPSLT